MSQGKIESEYIDLVLACEDFSDEDFEKYHCFMNYDKKILLQLMAHGPVLLKGGRGTGKSAFMRMANKKINEDPVSLACGIYLSLRHLPLLRTKGEQYEYEFLKILTDKIKKVASQRYDYQFSCELKVYEVHQALIDFSESINKRIVLFLDDAAHIGREAGLEEFFDIFRTLSSNRVSCKAAIYPGVTKFGIRFDVYNDAKVIEISRRYGQEDFKEFFSEVMRLRFPEKYNADIFSRTLSAPIVAEFIGLSVLGNVRSFVKGCSLVFERNEKITFTALNETLLGLASNFFWPMMEEIEHKIGIYSPMIESCIEIADLIYKECGEKRATSCIVHRQLASKYAKPLEILEYVGFISKREASRSMKSGGRGTRFSLNLCNALEKVPGSRLTQDLYNTWTSNKIEDVQFAASNTQFSNIVLAEADPENTIGILDLPITVLKKSPVFPFGLTDSKIELLQRENINAVGQLAEMSEADLKKIDSIGEKTVIRFKNTVEQAIWM